MDEEHQSLTFMETEILNPNPNSSFLTFGKAGETDEEDEPAFDENSNTRPKGRKVNSPWPRMKWSDTRVRLLIQVVACVGDDDVNNVGDAAGSSRKCIHKKGKWKTVSKIMVTKGCKVSPQQCEDKFNDLNKRFKRLNDILGRGVSCRVVENPVLMDSMPRLTVKMKEDVKKILSSKHLFYPEMCAYHNGQRIPNCDEVDVSIGQRGLKESVVVHSSDTDDDDHDHDDHDHDDDDDDDDHDDGERVTVKNRFRDEMNEFFEDVNNSKAQKKEWVRKRMLELCEQRVGIESEGFEMEQRRFKWERFCDRKDRELEVARLENERSMLENERTVLQLKHRNQVVECD
ncbi:uncharacterized protein LOC143610933 [Bidens hawaiensis]|uniref:uncharacterized protein LOC143610933 n=1 Tax=Bidens hawaiensis TaxID=980011 RepID=UPI0040494BB9